MSTRSVIERLQKENPEVFAEKKPEGTSEVTLSDINELTPPSELKKMGDIIARKRLTAPGISQEETAALLRRIGHGRK